MSKENKVNPGMYTQRGRLTPDDAAREMKKQREMGSAAKTDGKAQPHHGAPGRVTEKDKPAEDQEDEPEEEEQSEE